MAREPDPLSSRDHDWPAGPRRRNRAWLIAATIALAAAFTSAVATTAVGHYGFGGGWRGPGLMRGSFDPAQAEERADKMVRHLAIEIDATAEQQQKLQAIVKAAVKDLLPMREKFVAARQRAQSLLTAVTFDRAAVEAFRVEQLQLADAASRRFTQALSEAIEVLTPEQRRAIDARLTAWRTWRGWHRG